MNEQDLAEALADVRRAYRLVYAYQRRALDLAARVAEEVRLLDIAYQGWSPLDSELPRSTSKPPFAQDTSAWSFLPLYGFTVVWGDESARRGLRRRVDLRLRADTGFAGGFAEADPSSFPPEEGCGTILELDLWGAVGPAAKWSDAQEIARSQPPNSPLQFSSGRVGFDRHCIVVDLANVVSAAALEREVIEPLRRGAARWEAMRNTM